MTTPVLFMSEFPLGVTETKSGINDIKRNLRYNPTDYKIGNKGKIMCFGRFYAESSSTSYMFFFSIRYS